ncbi:flagellin FliC [bacterium]|jgi:flagellin|nr:flagellin FliC [bacterium]
MGLRIGTNIASMAAQRNLQKTSIEEQKIFSRLASGNRITSAGDDAAGLSISENLHAQIRSMKQAERNANDGISFVQVAEGGLSEVGNILVRMRELSIQAASDTIGDRERGFIDKEWQSLKQEIDRIANVTNFNGTTLLNGQAPKNLEFQVGARNADADRIMFSVKEYDVRTDALGIDGISAQSVSSARDSIDRLDEAISRVTGSRAGLGAMQNKLQSTVNNLSIAKENLSNARSRVMDADIAEEATAMAQKQILNHAGISVLAQANSSPQLALKLL